MRFISCKLEDLRRMVLPIGYEGENDHTRVQVDAGDVFKEYPAAVPSLKVHGPGGTIYPAEVTRDGKNVIWDIKASDCADAGSGEAQFTFTLNNVIVKSCIAKIKVNRSIVGGSTPPDPVQDWIDDAEEVLDDLAAMDNIAKTAEAGDVGKALSPKTVVDGVVTEWQYVEPGAGTEDYTDLENKPQIGGVTLSGDKSLHDLGIAAESAIPDVSGKANLSVVAPAFAQETANDAGSLVTYTDGVVYVLPEGHTAGTTWANTQKTATNIAEQQRLLLNAIDGLEDGIGDEELYEYEQGRISTSDYYKRFDLLEKDKSYILKVTAHTSGTYTLASSTATSSTAIVDTIATSVNFTADVPVLIPYTPTVDVFYLRLWVCDNWDIALCKNKTVWEAIEDSETVINEGFQKKVNFNRIDESKITPDKYYDSVGHLVDTSNGWVTTGGIPVSAGETIYFSIDNNGTRQSATMYFVATFSVTGELLDYVSTGNTYYTAQYDGIMHFSWKPGTTKVKPFCGSISVPSYYDEYGYSYEAKSNKPYFGVVWACVGDSMTEANACAKKHYFDYIAEELGFIPINYGVGGTGYAADRENNRAFYQRIPNITDSFDVLTIFGSVNDLSVIGTGSGQLPLGSYTDSGTTTVAGCINATIDAFYTLAPMKKIGIISQPPSVGSANNGNLIGTNAQDYNDMLAQICKNRGIPFLDMFNCSGLRPWDSDYRAEYYNEDGVQDTGVHPNSKGQKQISTKIREFMKTVI